jgi:hypothetical protein
MTTWLILAVFVGVFLKGLTPKGLARMHLKIENKKRKDALNKKGDKQVRAGRWFKDQ